MDGWKGDVLPSRPDPQNSCRSSNRQQRSPVSQKAQGRDSNSRLNRDQTQWPSPPPNRQHSEALRARKASRTGTSRHSGELPPRATARHRTSTAKSTATAKPSEPEKPKPHKQQQAQWETEKQGNGPPPDTKAVKQQHGKQQQRHSQGPADKHGSRNSGSDRALDMLLHHETNSASCSFVENPLMRLWLQRWMWCCGRTAAAERRRATGRRRIAPAVATARRKQ